MKKAAPSPANRLYLDYRAEAGKFRKYKFPIIDAHTHINGREAVKVYKQAAELYGISLTYSMTRYEQIDDIREVMGDAIRFITMPTFAEEEKLYGDTAAYMRYVQKYYDKGSRILKFWSAPRGVDIGLNSGIPDLLSLDSKSRKEVMAEVSKMNMIFMVHVSDPDTWFRTKYSDGKKYGSKASQYIILEESLAQYTTPFIAAHMGGWPEDLNFLDGLLSRHANLYLDCSAAKWMVRELSKHSKEEFTAFMSKWKGRVLYGSDIVTNDAQLEQDIFELYASRYYVFRTLFETDYNGESPISDPDLAMVDPGHYTESDAPALVGKNLPEEILESLYFKAAYDLLERYHKS